MNEILRKKADAEKSKIAESWGGLNWLSNSKILNSEGLTLGRVVIKKGMANPKHIHPNCDEVLYLLKGKLKHTVGDKAVIVEAGDTILIKAGIPHNGINIGEEDADMIVAYPASERKFTVVE